MAFDALNVGYELMKALRPVLERIALRDGNLAEQARKASSSIVLNLEESQHRTARDRVNRRRIAGGSAAEVRAALRTAAAWGYVEEAEIKGCLDLVDREAAMLWRLGHPAPAARSAPKEA